MFQIIPAIDLKDHHVVRLSQGKMDQVKVYSDNPLEIAAKWIEEGARRLHLVDLNGAFMAKPIHFNEITQIAKKFPKIKIEIGGGIRDLDTIQKYFEAGVTYCILGTIAIKNPKLMETATAKYPKKIILGIDAKQGRVAIEGWDETSPLLATDLVTRFNGQSIESVIYTDIAKDGMMQGMNIKSITQMAGDSPFSIIASGGFTSLKDVKNLKKIKNVSGVIAGKALYEGVIELKQAITLC